LIQTHDRLREGERLKQNEKGFYVIVRKSGGKERRERGVILQKKSQ